MTDQIQKSISEVQNYFKNKIIKGEYAIEAFSDPSSTVIIEDKFRFQLWSYLSNFELFIESHKGNFISFHFNPDEAAEAKATLESKLEPIRKAELEKEKLQEYNRLKAELEEAGIIDQPKSPTK